MRRIRGLLDGPQTPENGRVFWIPFTVLWVLLLAYPGRGDQFNISNLSLFFVYVPMALGLCLLWGYGGVLSFGQTAFFGIGGYTYAIVAENFAGTGSEWTLPVAVIALVVTAGAAAAFGYFVFYGQVSQWIVPLLALVLTLMLETFMAQTAGDQWQVGVARLGGYNGMTNIPPLIAGPGSSPAFYYFTILLCLVIYLGLRMLVNSRYGAVVVAVREDVERTRMLGHNVARRQVAVFTIAGVLAGLSGILYTSWGAYIDPSTMSITSAAIPVVYVAVGGRRSLTAVFLSTLILGYATDLLSVRGGQYALVVNGALLLLVMLFFPEGIFYSVVRWVKRRSKYDPRRMPEAQAEARRGG